VREVIARIVDGSPLRRVQGALRLDPGLRLRPHHGFPVAILANNGVLFSESALKATHFIETLQRAQDPARLPAEHHRLHGGQANTSSGGIAKDGAKMVHAVANAAVPKFTVVIGGSFGAGNYGMCGRAYTAPALDVAQRAHLGDGRRTGRLGPRPGEASISRPAPERR
jgi:3-methylcrotonyl-CoA carboxylase beta subunit